MRQEPETSLLEPHRQSIYALCRRSGLPPDDAEDVTQTILVKAYRALPAFRGEAQLRTWLLRITTNALIDYKKWRQRQPLTEIMGHTDSEGNEERREPFQGLWESQTPTDPQKHLLSTANTEQIRSALSLLTAHQRTVISLRLEDKSFSEIAAIMGQSSVAVRMTASRAYALLRKQLSGV